MKLEPDSNDRRATHIEQMRLFMLTKGLDTRDLDKFFCGMIGEGGAVWQDEKRILLIDYRHVEGGPYYALVFDGAGNCTVTRPNELADLWD